MSCTFMMSKRKTLRKFYKDFGLLSKPDKETLNKQELYLLYKRPKKDKGENVPHFDNVYAKDVDHQADLLFLPNDDGYKYALVVTDVATRISDAVPLRSKNAKEVMKGFKKIYERGLLKLPNTIRTDPGSEFKGEVKKYFDKNGVYIKYGKAGRSRQLAVVEKTNQLLGNLLLKRMQAQELLTGERSNEWVDDLPKAIKIINKKRKKKPPKVSYDTFDCEGDACNLLAIGTKVRPILDKPIDYVSGKRVHGKFRGADIKWDPEVRIIKNILLLPDQPPLYQLNDKNDIDKIDQSVAYTKNQLQVVPEDEEAPDPIVIRGEPKTFVVQKILDKKKVNGKIYYKVKWKGYPESEATWEPRSQLIEDVPLIVREYERNLN